MKEFQGKSKKPSIILFIILIILLAISILFISISTSKTIEAQVHVESGTVLVNSIAITDNKALNENDRIETLENSHATVILYESIIINLEENTEITISDLKLDHPIISQEKGSTWNTLTGILGIRKYSAQTGNTIASVRGTSFELSKNKILVGSNTVHYIIDEKEFIVMTKEVVEKINEDITKRKATLKEIRRIKQNTERAIKELYYLTSKTKSNDKKSIFSNKIQELESQTKFLEKDINFLQKEIEKEENTSTSMSTSDNEENNPTINNQQPTFNASTDNNLPPSTTNEDKTPSKDQPLLTRPEPKNQSHISTLDNPQEPIVLKPTQHMEKSTIQRKKLDTVRIPINS